MKARHRLQLMLGGFATFLALVTLLTVGVNPYRAWPVALGANDFVALPFTTEHIATPYRMRNEKPTTVLIGTSRILTGMEIAQGTRDGVFNAALAGTRIEDLALIARSAMQQPTVRRIVWGLDFLLFSTTWSGIHDPYLPERLAHAPSRMVTETIFSFDAVTFSGRQLVRMVAGRAQLPPARLFAVPWPASTIREQLELLRTNSRPADATALAEQRVLWRSMYSDYQRSPERWNVLVQLVSEIQQRGIDLVLFVPPFSRYELDAVRASGTWQAFQSWKHDVAHISPYRDYSGYTAVAQQDAFFTLPVFTHFHPAVGHTLLRSLLGESCIACGDVARSIIDTGVAVDGTNVEAHLAEQERSLPPLL